MQRAFGNLAATIDLERYLLECRRHEKNFLLRHDRAYLAVHTANFDSLLQRTEFLLNQRTAADIRRQLADLRLQVADSLFQRQQFIDHPLRLAAGLAQKFRAAAQPAHKVWR